MYSLVGIDGNAYSIMSYVALSMQIEGKSDEEIDEYVHDATSSDYAHLLSVSSDMVYQLNNRQ